MRVPLSIYYLSKNRLFRSDANTSLLALRCVDYIDFISDHFELYRDFMLRCRHQNTLYMAMCFHGTIRRTDCEEHGAYYSIVYGL
jgi:hypothetical protein